MVSWYSTLKITKDGEARNGDVSSNVEQESQLINGPQKASINGSNSTQWKGRLRYSNIVHGNFQTSSRNFHVDGESNDLEKSVDEESRVLLIIILGARMAQKALKALNNNNGVRKSTKIKYPIQRFTYDGFAGYH